MKDLGTKIEMKRMLIVNVNWRGDVLFSTPFIRALKKSCPESFIACLVVPRCYEILVNNPHLNEIIVYDENGTHKGLAGKLKLVSLLRKRNFDTAFLLHRSFTRRLLTFFAGISQRIGYDIKKRGFLLSEKIKPPQSNLHRIDYFLNLAKAVGICQRRTEDKGYEFFISPDDEEYADRWLAKQGISEEDFLVVINPGGNWLPKRWPKENFARLADALVAKYGAKIVISGAAKDLRLAQDIAAFMKKEAAISCGQTTLRQLGGILKRANLVISNDSGPMHIACALNCNKVIALFGPTSPKITGPAGEGTLNQKRFRGKYIILHKDIGCSIPCYNLDCPENRCMKAISVEDVLNEIKVLFPSYN